MLVRWIIVIIQLTSCSYNSHLGNAGKPENTETLLTGYLKIDSKIQLMHKYSRVVYVT